MSDFIKKLDNILLSEARLKSALKSMLRTYKDVLPPHIIKDYFHNIMGRWVGRDIDRWTIEDIHTKLTELSEHDWELQTLNVKLSDLSDATKSDMINAYFEWADPEEFYAGPGGQERKDYAKETQDSSRLKKQLEIYDPSEGEPLIGLAENSGFRIKEGYHRLGVSLLHGHKDGPTAALEELSKLLSVVPKEDVWSTIFQYMDTLDPVSVKAWVGTQP